MTKSTNELFANLLVAALPGGIEAQEAAGQRAFCASETLPRRIAGATREQLTALGFVFGADDQDELFVQCRLPPGWKIQATDHSMNSDLLDEQGRRRASIFYKAAFYDRKADMTMNRRFGVRSYGDSPTGPDYSPVEVTDCGVPVKTFGEYRRVKGGYELGDALKDKAEAWLDKSHPNWRDPLAYWS